MILVIMNFANPDMVGHTANLKFTIEEISFLDKQIKRIKDWIELIGRTLFITADHENAEITEDTHDGPNVAIVNAKYATQASYDMQGHELSSYFYRLNDLDTRLKEVEKFNARLVKIEGRLDVIEATLKQLGA